MAASTVIVAAGGCGLDAAGIDAVGGADGGCRGAAGGENGGLGAALLLGSSDAAEGCRGPA